IGRYSPYLKRCWRRIIDDLDHVSSLANAVNTLQTTLKQLSELQIRLEAAEEKAIIECVHELSASVERALETARHMSLQCSALAKKSQVKINHFDFPFLFDEEHRLLRNQFYMAMAQGERI